MAGAAGGFLTRAFELMLKECSGKKYPSLHKSIQSYIDATKEVKQQQPTVSKESNQASVPPSTGDGSESKSEQLEAVENVVEAGKSSVSVGGTVTAALANAGVSLEGEEAELVLSPLRLAFETKNLKVVEPALDCLHKLIAYDHLEGDPGLEGGKNMTLFTDILTMVCSCVDNSSSDSTTLQVLKVLLTAVASNKFRVHGEPLLGVIRLCYNVALNSKSPINQATSKAMLTQMISIIFRRMETDLVSSTLSVAAHVEEKSTEISESKDEEIALGEENAKDMTLGDALSVSQIKDTSPTYLKKKTEN